MIFNKIKILLSAHLKPKFAIPRKAGINPKLVLDIGIANASYIECKAIYFNAEYHGLDCINSDVQMSAGDLFFLRDLEDPQALTDLPGQYDLIIANHVLEHVNRGEQVFGELCDLLSSDGVLYVEVPSIRTAFSMKKWGNYHFHDDPTHITFYNLVELANIAMRRDCKIVSCGPISTQLKNWLSLPRALFNLVRGREWGPYLLHLQKKIDHIMVKRTAT
jgi:SAM-dependent methyltransferase